MCLRALVCLCEYVSVGVFACTRVCMRLYVMTSSYFLTTSSFIPPFFPLLPLPLPPTPFHPSLVCVCVCVCVLFFPCLFPLTLKAALHHPPPLHSPSCFDLCYQGISCVRLMGFSPGTPVFPFILWVVWNWIFALPFPRSDLT